jgi:dUTP pyrophosphatase
VVRLFNEDWGRAFLRNFGQMKIDIVNRSGLPLPAYATAGAAGMDLYAAVDQPVTIQPLGRVLIPTGLSIALPPGYEAQIRPRSGLALRHGISMPNTPGTIDSDYRGEIGVILVNLGQEPFVVKHGDRIAQMVIARYEQTTWEPVTVLGETERGVGGFGSTGG